VPLSDLTKICDAALEQGQTIVWDCDVSETGFSARQGLAIVPDESALQASKQAVFDEPSREIDITAEMRQLEFDNYGLTDDHLMHIIGSARDQKGKKYYYVKNSWGQGVGFNGYLFASFPYFQLNTIAIMVHKDVIPEEIREKLKTSSANLLENRGAN
jgi:bleomycin hydrolase